MFVFPASIAGPVPTSSCSPSFLSQVSYGLPLLLFPVGFHFIGTLDMKVGCHLHIFTTPMMQVKSSLQAIWIKSLTQEGTDIV